MKKILLTLLIVAAINLSLKSQGIYVKLGGGYGLPAAASDVKQNFLNRYDPSNPDFPNIYSSEVVTGSYGAGFNMQLAVGYKLTKNIIADFNFQYMSGQKVKSSNLFEYINGQDNPRNVTYFSSKASGLIINPSIVFSAGFGKGAPYVRFGLITASPKITEKENTSIEYVVAKGMPGTDMFYTGTLKSANSTQAEVLETYETTWEYNKGIALGYQAGIGFNWRLTERLDIYTEADLSSMTWYAREAEKTEYIYNGQDQLAQQNVYQKFIKFEKKFDPYSQPVADQPNIEPRKAFPFSTFAARAGIRFTIWQIKE